MGGGGAARRLLEEELQTDIAQGGSLSLSLSLSPLPFSLDSSFFLYLFQPLFPRLNPRFPLPASHTQEEEILGVLEWFRREGKGGGGGEGGGGGGSG